MTDFGVTDQGFVAKTLQDILTEIETDELAEISPLLDVSADQPTGQINGIFARALALLWELLEIAYNAFDPDRAESNLLDSVSKLTGTIRLPASYSTVTCSCVLDSGTLLESGTNFASVNGNPDVRFTPVADFTATTTGAQDVVFRAENTGAVQAPAGQLTVIATPVVGWSSVSNASDADVGAPVEDDSSLRLRRAQDVARSGSSTVDALRDDILALRQPGTNGSPAPVPQLQSVTMFENVGSSVDSNGLPPKSFLALVWDGDSPDPGNDDHIAQAIWDGKPAGIQPFGAEVGNAVDRIGTTHVVNFGRASALPIWLVFQLVTDTTYVGDPQFQATLAGLANAFYSQVGADVLRARLIALAFQVTGVVNVLQLQLGIAPSPTGTADITVAPFQIARFDSSQVANV